MNKRLLILADVASSHTEKWTLALAAQGYTIGLFSLNHSEDKWYLKHSNISLLYEPDSPEHKPYLFSKLKYLLSFGELKRVITEFKPDVLHAHYASSYGLLASLSKFKPYVLSVWGSDVFEFPKKSPVHKFILKYNLDHADRILSTSHAMKLELGKYTNKTIEVIPFGVDTKVFSPAPFKSATQKDVLHIGAIKSMEDGYGISTIIEAADLIKHCAPDKKLKFYLIGSGKQLLMYRKRVIKLGLSDLIEFTGKIPFSEIAHYHNNLDIFLNVPLLNESFGVSVIEAMACEKPVIVSNAPGLIEIVNEESGIIIKKDNATELASAILYLINSPQQRLNMGKAGRAHVLNLYDFSSCLHEMTSVYESVMKQEREKTEAMAYTGLTPLYLNKVPRSKDS